MKKNIFKLECITNLHVGSGDFNYGVIDNEVERDCLNGNPVIHASGVKGAFKDACELPDDIKKRIFGTEGDNKNASTAGAYKFFDAHLLSRPLRVAKNNALSYIPVTTPAIINEFLETADSFGISTGLDKLEVVFGGKTFLSNCKNIFIEGDEKANEAGFFENATLEALLGENYAIVEKFDDFKLPVIARNKLGENKNLWYEEYVPYHSTFYFMIMSDDDFSLDISKPIQFGGNASVGFGYTKIKKLF